MLFASNYGSNHLVWPLAPETLGEEFHPPTPSASSVLAQEKRRCFEVNKYMHWSVIHNVYSDVCKFLYACVHTNMIIYAHYCIFNTRKKTVNVMLMLYTLRTYLHVGVHVYVESVKLRPLGISAIDNELYYCFGSSADHPASWN